MIEIIFRCNLCHKTLIQNEDGDPMGYRLSFSGDGAILLKDPSEKTNSQSLICARCVRGLKYGLQHLPALRK